MASFTPDTDNEMFQLAAQLVNQTNRNIFLTGKAGTGKTTFLKYILDNCPKQIAVVAPTGVAAINAGGVTIHSFFQLPLQSYAAESPGRDPEGKIINRHELLSRLRINREKRKVFGQLELLIIDEVSMVSSDVMDAVDAVLRYVRRRPYELFGGVQVLMIGDLFQLPPVRKEDVWERLYAYYKSNFFFDSHAIQEQLPLYIEFNKIYRQRDEAFISLLNQVRNNALDAAGMGILESRFEAGLHTNTDAHDGYIILTTHNHTAREINTAALSRIEAKPFSYTAAVEDDFNESAYPADEILELKEGAQVMFIKNDSDQSKRFYNGKIGIVSKLEKDKVWVKCKTDSSEIEVKREKWENIRYTLNKGTQLMEPHVIGAFSQFPLRLAWAITIHKSQGLTFEKAVIDAGRAFEGGQVYVALSRCTSLEGMILKTRINANRLSVNEHVMRFFNYCTSNAETLKNDLGLARREYQRSMLVSTFDISGVLNTANELQQYLQEHSSSFAAETAPWLAERIAELNLVQDHARRFQNWIHAQFRLPIAPEDNALLQQKIKDAIAHFEKYFSDIINKLTHSPVQTDSRQHAKEYNDAVREICTGLSLKQFLFQGFGGRLDIDAWHSRKRRFITPAFAVNAYAGASSQKTESAHPELYIELKTLRDAICAQEQIPIYYVAGSVTLNEMTRYLPLTLADLRKINGFGDAKIKKYGNDFLEIIVAYCEEKGLASLIHEKKEKKEKKEKEDTTGKKSDTHALSYQMYREGKNIAEIAKERNLTVQTIEGHLSKYIQSGELDIAGFVSSEKTALIEAALKDFNGGSITPIKQELGDDISFGEIRMVMAKMEAAKQKA